jgi:hypothetical protein
MRTVTDLPLKKTEFHDPSRLEKECFMKIVNYTVSWNLVMAGIGLVIKMYLLLSHDAYENKRKGS